MGGKEALTARIEGTLRHSPRRIAASLAVLYILLCSAYIWISGHLVANQAATVRELERFETFKGLAFIVVSGLAFFGFAWLMLSRIARNERELDEKRLLMLVAERRAVAGVFASSIAHDFNNQLTVLGGDLQLLVEEHQLEQRDPELVASLTKAVDTLAKLSQRLTQIGKSSVVAKPVKVHLPDIIGDALSFTRLHQRIRHCQIDVDVSSTADVEVVPIMVHQMLLNLMLNAADAMKVPGGKIHLVARADDKSVVIEVHDSGPGVPPEKREQIFEAFYSSKSDGTGLGLLSVRACAESHGGKVTVDQSPILGGALFHVELPAHPLVRATA